MKIKKGNKMNNDVIEVRLVSHCCKSLLKNRDDPFSLYSYTCTKCNNPCGMWSPGSVGIITLKTLNISTKYPKSKKEKLFLKQKGLCFYCDKEMPIELLTKDHLKPLSMGGSNKTGNLVLACYDCNSLKSDYMPSDIPKLKRIVQILERVEKYKVIN